MDKEREASKVTRRGFLIVSADILRCASIIFSGFSIVQSCETRNITNSYREIVDVIGVPPERRAAYVRAANEDQLKTIVKLRRESVLNTAGLIGIALSLAGMGTIFKRRTES